MIEELRSMAVDKLGPLPAHRALAESIVRKHNPYDAVHHNRQIAEQLHLPDKADTVLFMGCTANYRETSVRDATISVLRKAGINFTITDEYCCGSPLLRTGQRTLAQQVAEHNLQAFERAGAERVITSCAGCYRTLSKDYNRLGLDLGIEVLHSAQLVNELIAEKKLKPTIHGATSRVTYHDPCHLGRHMGVYEEPRQILTALLVEFVEMQPNRKNAWCCGAGGGVKSSYPDLAKSTATLRLEQARAVNADLLVSACPFCKRNLADANIGHVSKVSDIVELVDQVT
jgi:Fe-S oxidoreductase